MATNRNPSICGMKRFWVVMRRKFSMGLAGQHGTAFLLDPKEIKSELICYARNSEASGKRSLHLARVVVRISSIFDSSQLRAHGEFIHGGYQVRASTLAG